MVERVPAYGSCVRCQRALGLASVKRGGAWYGNAACAEGRDCPLDERDPDVAEAALYSRPRRFFRARAPKELNGPQNRRTAQGPYSSTEAAAGGGASSARSSGRMS
jgi:hypothetical protein